VGTEGDPLPLQGNFPAPYTCPVHDGFAFPVLAIRLKNPIEHLAFFPVDRETLLGPLFLETEFPVLGV